MTNSDQIRQVFGKTSPISIGLAIAFIVVAFWAGLSLGQLKESQKQNIIEHEKFATKEQVSSNMRIIMSKLEKLDRIESRLEALERRGN